MSCQLSGEYGDAWMCSEEQPIVWLCLFSWSELCDGALLGLLRCCGAILQNWCECSAEGFVERFFVGDTLGILVPSIWALRCGSILWNSVFHEVSLNICYVIKLTSETPLYRAYYIWQINWKKIKSYKLLLCAHSKI